MSAYATAQHFASARRRNGRLPDFIGEAELYCHNPECPARTIRLVVKEDGIRTPARLLCPACGHELTCVAVLTFTEAQHREDREARASVNAQLYVDRARRRLNNPRAIVPVPIGVALNDRLPNTGPGGPAA